MYKRQGEEGVGHLLFGQGDHPVFVGAGQQEGRQADDHRLSLGAGALQRLVELLAGGLFVEAQGEPRIPLQKGKQLLPADAVAPAIPRGKDGGDDPLVADDLQVAENLPRPVAVCLLYTSQVFPVL